MNRRLGNIKTMALPAVATAVLALAGAATSAQSEETLTLDIEPQKAGPALVRLARSSGVQIMLTEGDGQEVEVDGLKGEYRFEEALAAMLTNTGLEYEFASANVVLVQQAQEGEDADSDAAAEEPAVEEEEEPLELEKQVVTGSRLVGGDPTARIYSYTAEDIAARGVSTLEEFFRTLPWTYSSITTQTNTSDFYDGTDQADEYIELGLGISTVNLRNMGSANTLVLLNGRRIAGTGEEDDFANILTIPLSAIERVDIQLDGASAVYGSDAIGGVVNFVTKRNYSGLSVDYRHEFSSTDANQTKAGITGGYAWGSGSVTAILSRDTSDPITNSKTGFTTLDLRPWLGPEFDFRNITSGQPGVACEYSPVFASQPATIRCKRRTPMYQLPASHSGLGATVDDFVVFERGEAPPHPFDEIDPQNGAESSTNALTLNFEQYLTDDLRIYADILYSKVESYQEYSRRITGFIPIPSSNAYNPFGKPMAVQYAPIREFEQGLLPTQFTESETESRNINFGVIWALGAHELQFEVTRTKSERETFRVRAKARRPRWDPTADGWYAALTSSDPNQAINVFGNGEAQGAAFEELLTVAEGPINGDSETRAYNLFLRGNLFDLWGGPVSYSAGAEYRENVIFRTQETTANLAGIDLQRMLDSGESIGVDRPTREITAYYAEFLLPLIGPENSFPGVHSLMLSLQARRDENESAGSSYMGSRGPYQRFEFLDPTLHSYWHPELGWQTYEQRRFVFHYADVVHDVNFQTLKHSRTSPSVGLRFQPVQSFTLRTRWSRSFRPPVWSDQFAACIDPPPTSFCSPDTRFRTNFTGLDPYHPDGPTEVSVPFGDVIRQVYNTDLENEYSDTYSVGFEWKSLAIPGLRWTVDWSKTDFTNRIEDSIAIQFMSQQRPELVMNHPQLITRDEQGNIVSILFQPINVNGKLSEILETSLQYSFATAYGQFTPRISYARILADYVQISAEETSRIDFAGTQLGPDEYRLEGSLSWLWNRFAADLFVYYTPGYVHERARFCGYSVQQIPGNRCTDIPYEWLSVDVSSLTTVDLTLTYRMDNGLRIRVGGRNILDEAAPATVFGAGLPYDPTRWDARGRVFFVDLNWEM
ncbi:MAG: TonB-dependent receptor [Gammaproteobacteria bacterium]|nr:TonB-dependent receptor [Gammaproteobacteria bacterium]